MSSILYKITVIGFAISLIMFCLNFFGVSWAWSAFGYSFTGTLGMAAVMIIVRILSKTDKGADEGK